MESRPVLARKRLRAVESRPVLARKRLRAVESRPRERISACSGAEAFPCGGFRLILSKKWRAGAYVRQISLPKHHFQPHRDHCAPKPPFFLTQGQMCIPDIKRANQTFIRGRRAKMQTSAKPVVKWWRAALDFVWPGSSRYRVTLCLVPFNGDQQRNSFHNLRTKSTMVASAKDHRTRLGRQPRPRKKRRSLDKLRCCSGRKSAAASMSYGASLRMGLSALSRKRT